jgi:formylglycine-generating enzyme required for sulfatase activity
VTPFYFGKTISTDQANYNRTYQKTVEVGRFPTNAWGLHDMHGNVWEWTQSIYNKNYDESGRGRMELGQSIVHVLRGGGSWNNAPERLRCAARFSLTDRREWLSYSGGLRLVRIFP